MSTQETSQWALLTQKRFGPFFATQFLGAFNDNVYKNALVVLLTFQAASWTTMKPELLANMAAGLFILPFFLFSATAGQLADKYSRDGLARISKIIEIVVTSLAIIGFYMHSLAVLMAALFLMGAQATLFGPVKYAILPQHLHNNELIGGNALVEGGTFVAILLGTLAGGVLAGWASNPALIAVGCVVIAVLGYWTSRGIPSAPAPVPDLPIDFNVLRQTWRSIGFARENRSVFLSILGISWFWLYGAVLLAQFPAFAKINLSGNEGVVTLLLGVFTLGIGAGSMLCEKLSNHQIEIGLVPLGSIGMTIFGLDLYFASTAQPHSDTLLGVSALLTQFNVWRILVDLLFLGVFGGFFIVPLYALMQWRSRVEQRARTIAANNILNALFMVVGALISAGLLAKGLSIPALFGIAAIANALVAVYIYRLVPEFLYRFLSWCVVRLVYRCAVHGREHIPAEGAALLVCNHVSFIDAVLISAGSPRPIRFVMEARIFKTPLIGRFFRRVGAIPISSAQEAPDLRDKAFARIAKALSEGELVGIFPEGAITRDGQLQAFRPGYLRVLQESPVPLIPMALSGLWGSFFSRIEGGAMKKPFRRGWGTPTALTISAPLAPNHPTTQSPEQLAALIANLRGAQM